MSSRLYRVWGAIILIFIFGVVACEATFAGALTEPNLTIISDFEVTL